jgi:hypothetical protein
MTPPRRRWGRTRTACWTALGLDGERLAALRDKGVI